MKLALRAVAVVIAVAGVIDPGFTRRVSVPPAVEVVLPPSSHPDARRALALRNDVLEELGDVAAFDGRDLPRARLAIGHTPVHADPSVPLLLLSLPPAPLEIVGLQVPSRAGAGQQIEIGGLISARALQGQRATIAARVDGMTISTSEHAWSAADETHAFRLVIPGLAGGVHRIQVSVATGSETAVADTTVAVTSQPFRVLVFEPRPSWPATFARRALEGDRRFEVSGVARSAPRVATIAGDAGAQLTHARLHAFEVMIVGGLEALGNSDLDAVDDFVARRGGVVIMLPDSRVPERLRARFDLPDLEEVLLEQPASLDAGATLLKASELLVASQPSRGKPLAVLDRENTARPVVQAYPFGNGTVVFSGALDAWRFRAAEGQDVDTFMRSLVADAALGAPPPVRVELDPALVRPGEPVTVRAIVRETEFVRRGDHARLPRMSAGLTDERGALQMIRLWPASSPGELQGTVTPVRSGRFVVSVSTETTTAEAVLTVADDVTHPRGGGRGAASMVGLTNGLASDDVGEVRAYLARLDAGQAERSIFPMRSAWWIVPFVVALAVEWTLRRRTGLR